MTNRETVALFNKSKKTFLNTLSHHRILAKPSFCRSSKSSFRSILLTITSSLVRALPLYPLSLFPTTQKIGLRGSIHMVDDQNFPDRISHMMPQFFRGVDLHSNIVPRQETWQNKDVHSQESGSSPVDPGKVIAARTGLSRWRGRIVWSIVRWYGVVA
jgi:hypothetical protein